MDSYSDIYSLKPLREVEPDWWKLKWKPLWRKTLFLYVRKEFKSGSLGIRYWSSGAHNGWHRSYDHFHIEIGFLKWSINFWIKWNYVAHKDGPSDRGTRKPLEIKKGEK